MPLDPSILLAAQPPRLPEASSPLRDAVTLAQLANLAQERQVRGLALQQAQEEQTGMQQLRALYASQGGQLLVTPEQQAAFVGQVGAINPKMGLTLGKEFAAQRHVESQITKEQAETRRIEASTLETQGKYLKTMFDLGEAKAKVTTEYLANTTPETWPSDRAFLINRLGIPENQLPEQYDATAVTSARTRAVGELERWKQRMREAENAQDRNLKAREVTMREQQYARELAKVDYGLGTDMNAALYQLYGQTLGTRGQPTPTMVADATTLLDSRKQAAAAMQGAEAARIANASRPLPEASHRRVAAMIQAERVAKQLTTEFTPEERMRYVGAAGANLTIAKIKQYAQDILAKGGDPRFARFLAVLAQSGEEINAMAGAALSEGEKDLYYGFIPSGKELSTQVFEEKLKLALERLPAKRLDELRLASTPAAELYKEYQKQQAPTGQTPPARPPSSALTYNDALIEELWKSPMNRDPKTQQPLRDRATIERALQAAGRTRR